MDDLTRGLKQYFGYSAFRPGQRTLAGALLAGRDVLGVMPTGAGKSLCYQLPAVLTEGTTLVISPLISLMKDQVQALKEAGIPAAYMNSSQDAAAYAKTLYNARRGNFRILYVAPERLMSADLAAICRETKISLVAVDEAHCVSQWGQDFRKSYLRISKFLARLRQRPPVGAFTATATAQVRDDIIRLLGLRDPVTLTTGFDRPNLYFDVQKPAKKLPWLLDYLREHPGESGIVYCATRKTVESVCEALQKAGLSAVRYHGGLPDRERKANQDLFSEDRALIMVATNAFGMGIDKSNVSFVIHYNMPKDLESYYQEAGRAGRDGSPAECVLLFSFGDVQTARYLIRNDNDNTALTEEGRAIYREQALHRLEMITDYCRNRGCYRKLLLGYFGESAPDSCGNCGNCCTDMVPADITVEAQKILSAVWRAEKQFPRGLSLTMIVRMLRGSRDKRVQILGLDSFSTFGIMRDVDRDTMSRYIGHLLAEGYLLQTRGEAPTLHTTPKSQNVLFKGEKVVMPMPRAAKSAAAKPESAHRETPKVGTEEQTALFEHLRKTRNDLAREAHIPPYMILSNASLIDMAKRRPRNMEELLAVSGIGKVKAEHYDEAFLQAIKAWSGGCAPAGTSRP